VESIIAQAKAQSQLKKLDDSADAEQVSAAAIQKQHEAVRVTNMASDNVAMAQAAVDEAKEELKKAEQDFGHAVSSAQSAGAAKLEAIEKKGREAADEAKAEAKKAERALKLDNSKAEQIASQLRHAENSAEKVGSASVTEDKALLKEAKDRTAALENRLSKVTDSTPKEPADLKATVKAEVKAQVEAQAKLDAAKDTASSLTNKASDDKAELKELRYQKSEANPAQGEVIKMTNEVEDAKKSLHREVEAETTIKQQDKKLKQDEKKEKGDIVELKTGEKKDVAALKEKQMTDEEKLAKKDVHKEAVKTEKTLEDKAVLKVQEVAMQQQEQKEEKEEEEELTVYTDATLKTKAEGAFIRANTKIGEIFDDVKPLIFGLKPPPHVEFTAAEQDFIKGGQSSNSTGGETGTGVVLEPPAVDEAEASAEESGKAAQASDAALEKQMIDNQLAAKEQMLMAKKKMTTIKNAMANPASNAPAVPASVMNAAKDEAKKVADEVAAKKGAAEAKEEAAATEAKAEKKVEAKVEVKIATEKKEIEKTEEDESELEERVEVVDAKVDGRKEDVKDLKKDLVTAKKTLKEDTVSPGELSKAESKVSKAQTELRSANAEVADARGKQKAAAAAKTATAADIAKAEDIANKRKATKETAIEKKIETSKDAVTRAAAHLSSANSKKEEKARLKSKIARLRADAKTETEKTSDDKKAAQTRLDEARQARQQANAKDEKAQSDADANSSKAVAKAKAEAMQILDEKKAALTEAKKTLLKAQMKAQEAASVAGVKAKMCRKLVPGNAESKDEAALCHDIKQESHCNFFDYARYCAKSCGTCIL